MNINTETRVLGLLGNPVEHSLSPFLHNQVFALLGLNCVYLPFKVETGKLEDAVRGIRGLNLAGVNVTIPYKEAVIPYLDELSPEASACGAVNVIKNSAGGLTGYNTDGIGFLGALRQENITEHKRVLFIGAGGAARSLAATLANSGASHLYFLDPDQRRAAEAAEWLKKQYVCETVTDLMNEENFRAMAVNADLLINCSPVGMYPAVDESPVVSLDSVPDTAVLCDIIYNPLRTKLLQMGQERGLKCITGLSMFAHQAALTLKILLDADPPLEYMQSELVKRLELES
ncbi:shikimate dehydrogenase [Syntrophomonas palmitatica]|uniref:shikimate dehydrogenase n=1 Tax=Syntrophomonas palmitatica TaxID=402877 RepID=UPI0006D02FF4|nr:shikimate dehydrogenase [Syntrophomonas palmitatica]